MKKIYLILIFFFFINLSVSAQYASLTAEYGNGSVVVEMELKSYDINDVLDSLNRGFEAEIFFEVRLYEKAAGFLSFFGDKLVTEEKLYYTAGIDIFEKNYNITTDSGEIYVYNTEKEFVENFFKISLYTLQDDIPDQGKEYYVLGRIQLNHVKLVPPLDLISLFSSTGIITDWVEVQLDGR